MTEFEQLRIKVGLTVAQLSREADTSPFCLAGLQSFEYPFRQRN